MKAMVSTAATGRGGYGEGAGCSGGSGDDGTGSKYTETASRWLNYLTTSASPVPELPAPARLVLVAVLDDHSTAKLGAAQYCPAGGVYRMCDGALEVPASARGADGIFVTDSGRYRVLTQQEHAALKRDEAAAATRAAAASIAPPPPPPTMPTALGRAVLRASTSLSALTINTASTGCAAHSQMATVIAIGPKHIRLSLARIKPLIDVARSNHNYVTTVILGVYDEAEAEAALAAPTPRLLLAGANELEALRHRSASGPVRAYLREAVLMGLVQGSGRGYGPDGENGVWCLPAAPVPLSDTPPALESRGDKTMPQWHIAINTQWREWYARYDKPGTVLDDQDYALCSAYTSFTKTPLRPPVSRLPSRSAALVASVDGPEFGTVDHTILWREGRKPNELWPESHESWAGTPSASVTSSPYWAVATWCHNTQSALRMPQPTFDRQLTLDDLEYDVWTTLATLALHKRRSGDASPTGIVQRLKGVLGPVVLAGRANDEPMRVSWWTDEAEWAAGATVLIPEAYVHAILADYNVKRAAGNTRPLLCSQGFLCLSNADEIPVEFTGVAASELDGERAAFGPRLWLSHSGGIQGVLAELHDSPPPSNGLAVYRTQADADSTASHGLLNPGVRVGTSRTHSVFYTSTTSDDQLSGLRVRWARGHRYTLDVDTVERGAQIPYERFRA